MSDNDSRNLVDRQFLSQEEAKQAIENAINDSGFTFEELKQQAKEHDFETTNAKICWMIIETLNKGIE